MKFRGIMYISIFDAKMEELFNTIVTTNFDNLIQDALIYSGEKRALVITHQDLAKFIKRDNTPLISKIHGDAHLHPFNSAGDTQTIPQELKSAIQSLFTNAKVICIGYRGDDESIKDLLEGCNRIDQVYWLSSSEPNNVSISNRDKS
ncbi:MAG: SIR2 family protein [Sulfurovum sp.]|nr:SIR2 family protein [Sulfurovum sp.]